VFDPVATAPGSVPSNYLIPSDPNTPDCGLLIDSKKESGDASVIAAFMALPGWGERRRKTFRLALY
jgi:hypothetical protein